MVQWQDFEHIHVVKKIKYILSSWWNIDTVFVDAKGFVKQEHLDKKSFCNPVTPYLFQKDNFVTSFSETVLRTIEDMNLSGQSCALAKWEEVGFDMAIVPILIENDLMGAIVAFGFLKDVTQSEERLSEIKGRLGILDISDSDLEKALMKIKFAEDKDRKHILELVDLMAQDIVSLHKEISDREERITDLNRELDGRYRYSNMIGRSKPMQDLYNLLEKIKTAESTILIQGENGTGKELIAKAIHYNSPRKDQTLVAQNCSAFNDNLLESELFGHVKGSFTGAVKEKKGLFKIADKGTFFLDEIGDTSPSMQVKLLRVLQEGTFTPVGATEPQKVNVRVVAATNKNLKEMVSQGTFREDLYYRLNVIHIQVPPLRERGEDIPLLADYFLSRKKDGEQKHKTLSKGALAKIYDYHWPGNVRELENEIERLKVLIGDEKQIPVHLLSPKILETGKAQPTGGRRLHGRLKDALEDVERQMIKEGLKRTGWNKSQLAKELGISRASLITKVEKYQLDKRKMRTGS